MTKENQSFGIFVFLLCRNGATYIVITIVLSSCINMVEITVLGGIPIASLLVRNTVFLARSYYSCSSYQRFEIEKVVQVRL